MDASILEDLRAKIRTQPLQLALTTIIYELRTYLTRLYGNVNVLRSEQQEPDETLEETMQNLEDLRMVIDQLLVHIFSERLNLDDRS